MVEITPRRRIITDQSRARAGAELKARLAAAGFTALLLALGVGKRRKTAPLAQALVLQPQALTAKSFLVSLYQRISDDRVVAISAGVTFFLLLAIFPATAAAFSVYGLFADTRSISGDLSSLSTVLPGGALDILGEQIKRLASKSDKSLGLAAIGGIAFSIWSANAGVKALFDALNIVLKEKETRGFIKLNAVSLLFTLGALAFVLLAIAAVTAVPAFLKGVAWSHYLEMLLDIGRWPLVWAVLTFGIALLYRFGPGRNDIPWRWITWGSALSAFVWIVASMGFSYYAAHFGTYNKTYGSLGAGIGLMTWLWLSVIVILVGEEVNEILEAAKNPQKRAKEAQRHPLGVSGKATVSAS